MGPRRATIGLRMDVVTTAKRAAVTLELAHGHGREGGGAVVTGGFVVHFVDGHGGVDDLGLDGFLVDDGLDCFVHVVMHCLALHSRGTALLVRRLGHDALVAQLGRFGLEGALGGIVVAVVELAADDLGGVVDMLLWQDLPVLNGLDDAAVVVLMDFSVHGGLDLLVPGWFHRLLCHGGCRLLLDGCIVASGARHEVVKFGFGAIHSVSLV